MKNLLLILPLWASVSVSAQSDSANHYFKKGLAEKESKRYLVASQAFDKALIFNPTDKQILLESGLNQLLMHRIDAAKTVFIKLLSLDPNSLVAKQELMNIDYNYRQYPQAVELAESCPQCAGALKIIGLSYYQQEEYSKAESYLLQGLKQTPEDAELTYTLGRNYVDMEEYKKAMPFYEKAINLPGAKNTWMYELGILYSNHDEFKKAILAFRAAADHGYRQTNDFTENFGFALLQAGEYEKGEEALMSVWSKKTGNTDILRSMAEILYKAKQYDRSLSYCQKLIEINDKDGKALYQAGLNFQRKGQRDRGQQMCDKAIEIDPSLTALRTKKEFMGL